MSRLYLNLTAGSWRQLRRNWKLPSNPMLAWQTLVPGTMFSAMAGLQRAISREQLDNLYRDLTSHPMVAMVL